MAERNHKSESNGLIIVAEDDDAMRCMLCDSLLDVGYQVEDFADGAFVLERLQAQCDDPYDLGPALVITDVQMPHVNGFKVLKWMRQNFPNIPVIVITAIDNVQVENKAISCGATLVFHKPFALHQFLEAIQTVLETQQR